LSGKNGIYMVDTSPGMETPVKLYRRQPVIRKAAQRARTRTVPGYIRMSALLLQVILVNLPVQGALAHPEGFRGLPAVPPEHLQCPSDQLFFSFLQRWQVMSIPVFILILLKDMVVGVGHLAVVDGIVRCRAGNCREVPARRTGIGREQAGVCRAAPEP